MIKTLRKKFMQIKVTALGLILVSAGQVSPMVLCTAEIAEGKHSLA